MPLVLCLYFYLTTNTICLILNLLIYFGERNRELSSTGLFDKCMQQLGLLLGGRTQSRSAARGPGTQVIEPSPATSYGAHLQKAGVRSQNWEWNSGTLMWHVSILSR